MLRLRRGRGGGGGGVGGGKEEGGGGGEEGGEEPTTHANGLIAWGHAKGQKLGGGYSNTGDFYAYPQGVVDRTNVVQMATGSSISLALDDEGRVWSVGNGEEGAGGIGRQNGVQLPDGTKIGYDADDWSRVAGGIPLYPAEFLGGKGRPFGKTVTLTASLSSGSWGLSKWGAFAWASSAASSLTVTALAEALAAGTNVRVASGTHEQTFTLSAPAAIGATSIAVYPQVANFAYPIGSTVRPGGWWQRRGPLGPVLPSKKDVAEGKATWTIAAVANGGAHCLALTTDGRVLGWGGSKSGDNGNGWEFHDFPIEDELEGRYPQWAPWWVQTGGPAQAESGQQAGRALLTGGQVGNPNATYAYDAKCDGTAANILTGVKAIACSSKVSFFLKTNGEVWYAGGPAGGQEAYRKLYATKDPIFTPDPANKPVAIACTHQGYMLLLENGEVRFVGNNAEYTAGNGVAESAGSNIREVAIPQTAPGVPVKGVIAIAKGEFSMKMLKSDGTVWTCGSNIELQQGIAGFSQTEPQRYVTEMKSLHEGENAGRKVIAISGAGEETHFPGSTGGRGPGANGGDGYLYLMDDHTIRVTGLNWGYESGGAERWEGGGVLGTGNTENSPVPVQPMGVKGEAHLTNIKQICAGVIHMMVLQEPGAPAARTVTVDIPSLGVVRVRWADPPGVAPGAYPLFDEEEGWAVTLKGKDGAVAGLVYKAPPAGSGNFFANRDSEGHRVREKTFTVVRGGTYDVTIASATKDEFPALVGSSVRTAVGGKLTVEWENPAVPQPAYIVEIQRTATYPAKSAEAVTLTSALTMTPTTALAVTAVPEKLKKGDIVTATSAGHVQNFIVSAPEVLKGATSIPVNSITPNFAYPAGTSAIRSLLEDWKRVTPEVPDPARSATFTLPAATNGVVGEEVNVRVFGAYEGAFKHRLQEIFVP